MTTIIFPPNKFVCYLRQPKSASLTTTKWLVELAKINKCAYLTSLPYQQKNYNVDVEKNTIITHHMTAQRIKDTVPQWWDKMEKIVTVRNPWNILASKFYHMKKLGVTQVNINSFEDFCKGLLDLRGTLNPGKDYYSINREIVVQHIVPVESLSTHLQIIFDGYILPDISFENVGTVSQDQYKLLYTDWINEQILSDFEFEIKTFDYKF